MSAHPNAPWASAFDYPERHASSPLPNPDALADGMGSARGVIVGVGWSVVGLTVFGSAGFFLWRFALAAWAFIAAWQHP